MMNMNQMDPKKTAAVRQISSKIRAKMTVDHAKNSIEFAFTSADPQATALIPELVKQLSSVLGMQLNVMFGITGEIVDINKPAKK